jgi:charged multivesicular body protein 4
MMSIFKLNLFGAKKVETNEPVNTNSIINTVSKIKEQISSLEKRRAYIDKKIEIQNVEIKNKIAKNDKKGAIFSLKKRKNFEEEILKIDGMCLTLEDQLNSLESASINSQYISTLKNGNNVLKTAHKNLDNNGLETLIDDIAEQKEISQSINDLMNQTMNNVLDDPDLLDEFESLQNEISEPKTSTVSLVEKPQFVSFPITPENKTIRKPESNNNTDDEYAEELNKLRQAMLS